MTPLNDSPGSSEPSTDRLAPLGRALIGAGAILLVLRSLPLTTRMPGLPAFWYANQPMWIALSVLLLVLGWNALWMPRRYTQPTWRPTCSGRRFRTAVVYVGDGCHLCDDATEVLHSYREWLPAIQQIDIRSDADLTKEYGTCIPVVVLDGKVRFRGKVNEELLRRLIEGTPPSMG